MSAELHAALAVHQAGQLDQAEAMYRQLLQAHPDNGDALNLLGTLLCQRGNTVAAIPLLEAASKLIPAHTEVWLNLAKALRMADCAEEALTVANIALEMAPERVDALILQGRCLRRLGRESEARTALEHALQKAPDELDAHLNLGDLLQNSAPEAAVQHYLKVLKKNPDHTGAINNLALIHKAAGRLNEAQHLLEQAIARRPDMHEAHNNLGNVLLEAGMIEQAIRCYERALELNPDNPSPRIHLGNALRLAGRTDEAAKILMDCLSRWQDSSGAYNNLGILLDERGDHAGAISQFNAALTHAPQDADIWANLGGALLATSDHAGARKACEQALLLKPDSAVARFGMANIQLLEGDWLAGWQNYESRWQGGHQGGKRIPRPALRWPQWRGEAVPPGQSIFVFHEQGFGDTLQFMRYLPLLREHFSHITFICQASIIRLARASLPSQIEIQPSDAARELSSNAHFDWQLPLLSLPLALGLTPSTTPLRGACLRAPPEPGMPLQLGLCWSGNPSLPADAERSIPLSHFNALLDLPGIRWHALVHGAEITDPRLTDAMQEVKDFADTARRINSLDLVISVDTAVAHLAAGMGKPVWLLNRFAPDWRWGWQGEHSAWYPSLRQFRQQAPGDWLQPLAEIEQSLRKMPFA